MPHAIQNKPYGRPKVHFYQPDMHLACGLDTSSGMNFTDLGFKEVKYIYGIQVSKAPNRITCERCKEAIREKVQKCPQE